MKTIDANLIEALSTLDFLTSNGNTYRNPINILTSRAKEFNQIVGYLSEATHPLRCKEIADMYPKHVYTLMDGSTVTVSGSTWQNVSAMLRFMLKAGIVEKIQIGTEIIRGHIQVPIYGYRLAAVEG